MRTPKTKNHSPTRRGRFETCPYRQRRYLSVLAAPPTIPKSFKSRFRQQYPLRFTPHVIPTEAGIQRGMIRQLRFIPVIEPMLMATGICGWDSNLIRMRLKFRISLP